MRNRIISLFELYKKLELPVKVSFWFFFCSILQKGLSFITTPIFTRILSTNDYGIVTVYNSWEQILIIFISMSLSNSVFSVGLVKFDKNKDEFQTSMMGLEIVCSVVMSTLFLLIYRYVYRYIQLENKYIYVMLSYCFFSTVFSMWTTRERFEYNYRRMLVFTLLNTFFGVLFSLIFVYHYQDKAFGKIIGSVIMTAVLALVCFADSFKRSKTLVNFKYWKFALLYNIPMLFHFLSSVLLNQLDRLMIQNMCGLDEAGIYAVSYNAASIVYIVNQALSASYNPWVLQRIKAGNYRGIKDINNYILSVYCMILVVIILFAPEIISFMAPKEYYEGIYIIPPVACSMFFILLFNVFAPVEYYSLKTKFLGIASTLAALVNVVLNYIFIRKYGYLAAGYTTLVCYIVYAFSHFIYSRICCKQLKIVGVFDYKTILFLSIFVLLVSIITSFAYSYTIMRYLIILVISIIGFINRKRVIDMLKLLRKEK